MREVLFSKYSMERSPQFAIRTSIVRDGERRWVEKSPMTKDAAAHVEKLASSYDALCRAYEGTRVRPCPVAVENGIAKFEFLEGEFFHEKLGRLIEEKDEEGILALCEEYVSIVKSGAGVEKFRKTPEFVRVFGDVELPDGLTAMAFSNVDWIFENLIEKENGDIALIDYEWCFDFPVPLEYVLYRSLYISFMRWGAPTFVDQTLCPQMGITSELISALWQIEAGFTQYVARGEQADTMWHEYLPILQKSLSWKDWEYPAYRPEELNQAYQTEAELRKTAEQRVLELNEAYQTEAELRKAAEQRVLELNEAYQVETELRKAAEQHTLEINEAYQTEAGLRKTTEQRVLELNEAYQMETKRREEIEQNNRRRSFAERVKRKLHIEHIDE